MQRQEICSTTVVIVVIFLKGCFVWNVSCRFSAAQVWARIPQDCRNNCFFSARGVGGTGKLRKKNIVLKILVLCRGVVWLLKPLEKLLWSPTNRNGAFQSFVSCFASHLTKHREGSEGILLKSSIFANSKETSWAYFANVLQRHFLIVTRQDPEVVSSLYYLFLK